MSDKEAEMHQTVLQKWEREQDPSWDEEQVRDWLDVGVNMRVWEKRASII